MGLWLYLPLHAVIGIISWAWMHSILHKQHGVDYCVHDCKLSLANTLIPAVGGPFCFLCVVATIHFFNFPLSFGLKFWESAPKNS